MLGPALRALRSAAPAARLDLLAAPAGAAAAPLLDSVHDVLTASVPWQDADGRPVDPDALASLAAGLDNRCYDVAVIFTSFSQSPWPAAYACALAGIPVRAGASREFGGGLLTHWVDDLPDGLHQVDRALELLRRLEISGTDSTLTVSVPPAAVARARDAVGSRRDDRDYAVLMPGASCAARRYPAERFADVARLLAGTGLRVAVAGNEREADLVERVRAGAGAAGIGLPGTLDVPAVAALLRDAAVAVTNNAGGMHLADAVGVPLVALFAGTEREDEYRPRSARAVLLRRPTPCSPCRAFVCPYGHECLDIPADVVADAAVGLLGMKPAGRTAA
jgi:ADP-heptose:LPS heptosyltransferase